MINLAIKETRVRERIACDKFWYKIEQTFGSGGGIYKLSCLDQDGLTIPVGRLLGEDPEGVLYIGMANSFLDRVINLKKSLSPKHSSSAHEAGSRHKSHEAIASRFAYDRLVLDLIGSENPRIAEVIALQTYMQKFGELPPLNRAA